MSTPANVLYANLYQKAILTPLLKRIDDIEL